MTAWRGAARRLRLAHNELGDLKMLSAFRNLMKNDRGATAIEYTLIASLVAVAGIVAMNKVGSKIHNVLTNVSNAMT
jgi:pilus assembly protein Flp/PilA